jgi:hypothetical protein
VISSSRGRLHGRLGHGLITIDHGSLPTLIGFPGVLVAVGAVQGTLVKLLVGWIVFVELHDDRTWVDGLGSRLGESPSESCAGLVLIVGISSGVATRVGCLAGSCGGAACCISRCQSRMSVS